jgi:hypothetical protein
MNNKETLEEAAEKYAESKSSNFRNTHIRDFKEGAKYQAERMYSEEEVIAMLLIKHDGLSPEYVLQQFKNK